MPRKKIDVEKGLRLKGFVQHMASLCGLGKQDFLSFVFCDIPLEEYARLSNQPT
jgi:hypothetical protein